MKKLLGVAFLLLATTAAFSQQTDTTAKPTPVLPPASVTPAAATPTPPPPPPAKKKWSDVDLSKKPQDHFMMMIGYDNWAGKPDTILTKGFSRSFSMYFMMAFPFKTDPRFSVGAGLGIGVSNIYFDHQVVGVVQKGTSTVTFSSGDASNYYKKFKLVNTYLEIPLELRFAVDPEHSDQSWKFAVGVKPGLLLSAYTKGKNLYSPTGQLIYSGIEKESSKVFFNGTSAAATVRISKGFIGVFGQFRMTPLLKSGAGPSIYPFSVGIVLSGL